MAMQMFSISVHRDDERMPIFRETRCQFVPDLQRLLGRDFAWTKTLSNLIRKYVPAALIAPGYIIVFFLREQELLVNRARVAGESDDEFALLSF